MKLNRGVALGGAYRHDFNSQITNYQREDALDRARRSEQRAQMKMAYDGMEEMPDVIGEFDRNSIREKYEKSFTDVGSFIKNNPNFDTDPEAYGKLAAIKNGFTNDQDVRRAITSTEQFKQMQDFIQANPDANPAEMTQIKQSWDMYNKTGTMDGVNKSAFTFVNPGKAFNSTEYLLDFGKSLKTDTIQFDALGSYSTVEAGNLRGIAMDLVQGDSKEAFQIKAQFRQQVADGRIDPKTNIIDYIAGFLQQGVGKSYIKTSGSGGSSSDKEPAANAYKKLFNTSVSEVPAEFAGDLIDYNKQSETIKFDTGRTPVLAMTKLVNGANAFTQDKGKSLGVEHQFNFEAFRGLELAGRPTGTIVRIGDMSNNDPNDTSALLGVETLIEIPATGDGNFKQIMKFLVDNKLAEDDDAINWFSGVDPEEYKFANENITFGIRKNDEGEDETILAIKVLVPKEYSSERQLKYNQNYVSKADSRVFGNSEITESQNYGDFTMSDGTTQRFLVDGKGQPKLDKNDNLIPVK
jgi:hypothetical protein